MMDWRASALLAQSLPGLLGEWPSSARPPQLRESEILSLSPLGTPVGCDVPRYSLATVDGHREFWIMKSGGFAGEIAWYGPLVVRLDGSVGLAGESAR